MKGGTFDSVVFVAGCVSGSTGSNSTLTVNRVSTSWFTCSTFSRNKTNAFHTGGGFDGAVPDYFPHSQRYLLHAAQGAGANFDPVLP